MILVCSRCGRPYVRVVESMSQTVIIWRKCGFNTDISDGVGGVVI